jgi:hypothetical protein
MKTLRWLAVGMLLGLAATAGSTELASSGLSGLSEQLNATGRIGVYVPKAPVQIAPAVEGGDAPRELPSPIVSAEPRPKRPSKPADLAEEELLPTDRGVRACRVEIARRREVQPDKVAAKEVVVRFSIDRDGHVRDAEALFAPDTDLEIAACAKRVITQWTFAKRPSSALNVERTYRFR